MLAKPLLGNAWAKLYSSGDPPVEEVVPQQVARALLIQLGQLEEQLTTGSEMDTRVEQSLAAIKAGSKRYRAAVA